MALFFITYPLWAYRRKRNPFPESVLEAGHAAYMPGVYKLLMVSMWRIESTDESLKVRIYTKNTVEML